MDDAKEKIGLGAWLTTHSVSSPFQAWSQKVYFGSKEVQDCLGESAPIASVPVGHEVAGGENHILVGDELGQAVRDFLPPPAEGAALEDVDLESWLDGGRVDLQHEFDVDRATVGPFELLQDAFHEVDERFLF